MTACFEKNKKNKGVTLIEILVATVIFIVFITIVYDAIFSIQKREKLTKSEIDVQSDANTAMQEMLKFVHNSTWDELLGLGARGIWYIGGDYRHALVMQSSLNTDNKTYARDASFNPLFKRYILYYVVRPPGDTCEPAVNSDGSPLESTPNPDVNCPHKWLIRRDLVTGTFSSGVITYETLSHYMTNNLTDNYYNNVIPGTSRRIAENILNFTITPPIAVSDGLYTIYYNGSEEKVNNKAINLTITAFKGQRAYNGEDLTRNNTNLFKLEGSAEPQN